MLSFFATGFFLEGATIASLNSVHAGCVPQGGWIHQDPIPVIRFSSGASPASLWLALGCLAFFSGMAVDDGKMRWFSKDSIGIP